MFKETNLPNQHQPISLLYLSIIYSGTKPFAVYAQGKNGVKRQISAKIDRAVLSV
jgi:hypothetical protein